MINIKIKKSTTNDDKCHVRVNIDVLKYTTQIDANKIIRALLKMFKDEGYEIEDEFLKSKVEVKK